MQKDFRKETQMNNPIIVCSFRYNLADLSRATRFYLKSKWAIRILLFVGLAMTIALFSSNDFTKICVLVAAMVLIMAYLYLLYLWPVLQWRKEPTLQIEYTLLLDEQGLTWKSEHSETKIVWTSFTKLWETKDLYLLFYTNENYLIIPKRIFSSPAEIESFKQVVSNHLSKKSI